MLTAAWIFYGALASVRMATIELLPLSRIEIIAWVVAALGLSVWAVIEERRRERREDATDAKILQLTRDAEYSKGVLNTLAQFGSRSLEILLDERSHGQGLEEDEKQQILFSLDNVLRGVLIGQNSSLSTFGQLSYLQRQEAKLQRDLECAAPKDKLVIVEKLAQILGQQLTLRAFQAPSQKAMEQHEVVVKKLEALKEMVRTLPLK